DRPFIPRTRHGDGHHAAALQRRSGVTDIHGDRGGDAAAGITDLVLYAGGMAAARRGGDGGFGLLTDAFSGWREGGAAARGHREQDLQGSGAHARTIARTSAWLQRTAARRAK